MHKHPLRKIKQPSSKDQKECLSMVKKILNNFKLSKSQFSRNICKDLFQEYMDMSSIHGLQYPVEKGRSIYERCTHLIFDFKKIII